MCTLNSETTMMQSYCTECNSQLELSTIILHHHCQAPGRVNGGVCSPIINIIIWLCQEVVILCRSLLHKSSHVIFPIWKFRRRCLFGDKGYLICLTVRTLNMDEYKPNDQINGLALVFNHPLAKLSSHLNCSATGHSNILQVMHFC